MKKRIVLLILTSLFLVGCGNTSTSDKCDPDDIFCDPDEETKDEVMLQEDKNATYVFDNSVSNENASANYEIFIRSFYDSNNDGIGDLNGIKEKLPYLQELGIKNLWLMPFNPSPSYHGYDVKDYYEINPDYGTLDDFKDLVETAKKYNIGILMDFVINHCSNENQWFIDSYNDYIKGNVSEGSKADWFNWSTTQKDGYNRYKNSNIYYESRFSYTMPDLNLSNKEVLAEVDNICKYWLEMGVEGFRLDAVLYYQYMDTSYNVNFLKWLKETCKKYKEDTYIVGECWASQNTINDYYESGCDSFFSFQTSLAGNGNGSIVPTVKRFNSCLKFGDYIEEQEKAMKTINPNALSSYFLSNHDMDRSSANLGGYNAKAAASLTYLLPGTPYIYYGEEIGLLGKRVTSPDDQSDVRRRLPMVWDKANKVGECDFPEKNRQDLNKNDQVKEGVNDQLSTNYSLLNHYKKVLNLRNKYSFIKDASFTNLTSLVSTESGNVLIYELKSGDNKIIVVHNFELNAVKVNIGKVSYMILDSINVTKKIPELDNSGNLLIGSDSTVILNVA